MTRNPLHPSVHALVGALWNDPFYVAIVEDCLDDDRRRKQVLASYFDLSIAEAQARGRFDTLAEVTAGAALWLLPDGGNGTAGVEEKKDALIAQVLGPRGLRNYRAILDYMNRQLPGVINDTDWYLSILGISPDRQGAGLGARLLAPALEMADQARSRCYIETFEPRNVPFYARQGFATVATHQDATTGSAYVIMIREPGRRSVPQRTGRGPAARKN